MRVVANLGACDVRGLRQSTSRPPSHAHVQHPNVVTTYEAEVVPLAVVPEAAMTQDGDACEPEAKPRHTKATTAGEGDVYKMLIIQV